MKDLLARYGSLARYAPYAKYASWVGYPLFYIFCLALFLSLTFPYDKLKERIVASFNADQRASGGQQELHIESMSGWGLGGVRMRGIALLGPPSEPGKPPSRLVIDEAAAGYALLPMLVGSSDLSFDVDAFGGEARGSYEVHGNDKAFELRLDSVDLGKVGPLVQLLGVPLEGKLGGSIRLTMPEGKASKGSGAMSLESRDTAVGDGKAKIKGTLALPRIDVGTLTIAADARDGVLKVTKFVAGGKDLDLQGDGKVTLRDGLTDSLSDLQVRFRINDAYRGKNDLTKSLFGAPGSTASGLFELADPKVRQSRRADGSYGWAIRGPLGQPDFVPAGR